MCAIHVIPSNPLLIPPHRPCACVWSSMIASTFICFSHSISTGRSSIRSVSTFRSSFIPLSCSKIRFTVPQFPAKRGYIGNLNGMYRIIVCKRRRLHEQFSGADRGDEGCARVKTRAKCENGDERDGGNPSRRAAAGDSAVCEEVARAVRHGGSRRVTARLSGQRELSE